MLKWRASEIIIKAHASGYVLASYGYENKKKVLKSYDFKMAEMLHSSGLKSLQGVPENMSVWNFVQLYGVWRSILLQSPTCCCALPDSWLKEDYNAFSLHTWETNSVFQIHCCKSSFLPIA